jgi:hypothetical protein
VCCQKSRTNASYLAFVEDSLLHLLFQSLWSSSPRIHAVLSPQQPILKDELAKGEAHNHALPWYERAVQLPGEPLEKQLVRVSVSADETELEFGRTCRNCCNILSSTGRKYTTNFVQGPMSEEEIIEQRDSERGDVAPRPPGFPAASNFRTSAAHPPIGRALKLKVLARLLPVWSIESLESLESFESVQSLQSPGSPESPESSKP